MLDVENKSLMITNVPYMRNQKNPTTATTTAISDALNVLTIASKVNMKPNPTSPL